MKRFILILFAIFVNFIIFSCSSPSNSKPSTSIPKDNTENDAHLTDINTSENLYNAMKGKSYRLRQNSINGTLIYYDIKVSNIYNELITFTIQNQKVHIGIGNNYQIEYIDTQYKAFEELFSLNSIFNIKNDIVELKNNNSLFIFECDYSDNENSIKSLLENNWTEKENDEIKPNGTTIKFSYDKNLNLLKTSLVQNDNTVDNQLLVSLFKDKSFYILNHTNKNGAKDWTLKSSDYSKTFELYLSIDMLILTNISENPPIPLVILGRN